MSTYASIGRNVESTPMSDAAWKAYRRAVRDVLKDYAGPIVSDTAGAGLYADMPEETAVIVSAGTPAGVGLHNLRVDLSAIAYAFGQETIALTVAPVAFVAGAVFADRPEYK